MKKEDSLINNAHSRSALPMIISENGRIEDQVREVIYCADVSTDFFDNMPRTITLVRENNNGTVCKRTYVLASEMYTSVNQNTHDNDFNDWMCGARGLK